ncbi:MAG: type II toxin-antitoxin system RelE/ParE family toxin [Bacteroidales bacterium]|nr:type II toxin-antitoxin system RelE/ParE family toxin [Bacteroidales bacterium]
MAEFILSERSKKDLRDITNYTVQTWSETQAVTYYNVLLDACEFIAERVGTVGRSYEEIRSGLYGYHTGRHIIFYRILSKDKIRIVRILHDQMDFPQHL